MNIHLEDTASAAELLIIIHGMVMHHHGPECHAKRLVCYLQGQGHSDGSIIKKTVSTIFTELLIFLQPNLVWWYIISWSVLFKNWFVVFKVKVTVRLKLHWLFVYLISSVPLISWQLNLVCWFTSTTNKTKYNKIDCQCSEKKVQNTKKIKRTLFN